MSNVEWLMSWSFLGIDGLSWFGLAYLLFILGVIPYGFIKLTGLDKAEKR